MSAMRGVILGQGPGGRNARGHRVWLPPGAMRDLQAEVISTCMLVTKIDGTVCGAKFTKGQEHLAEQHAVKCAREHGDVIAEYWKIRRPDVMKPWDPEYSNWLARNRVGISEGRVKW